MSQSILVAGVGNIFLGDDAFGVQAVRALAALPLPTGVSAMDFGIRGFDLAFALLDPWYAVVIVDTLMRGGSPGTLYTIQPDLITMAATPAPEIALDPHGMDPLRVLHLALSMGAIAAQVYVVGCEPESFGDELEGRMGLSVTVQASIPESVTMVETLVSGLLRMAAADIPETVFNV